MVSFLDLQCPRSKVRKVEIAERGQKICNLPESGGHVWAAQWPTSSGIKNKEVLGLVKEKSKKCSIWRERQEHENYVLEAKKQQSAENNEEAREEVTRQLNKAEYI